MVGVVGASGCGKSTLLKLMYRFYDADAAGSVEVGGVNVKDLQLASLQEQISIVSQVRPPPNAAHLAVSEPFLTVFEPFLVTVAGVQDISLFNDTIAYNIGYGLPGATREQIEGTRVLSRFFH